MQANALKVPITEPVALIGVQALGVPLLLAQSSLTLAAAACRGNGATRTLAYVPSCIVNPAIVGEVW